MWRDVQRELGGTRSAHRHRHAARRRAGAARARARRRAGARRDRRSARRRRRGRRRAPPRPLRRVLPRRRRAPAHVGVGRPGARAASPLPRRSRARTSTSAPGTTRRFPICDCCCGACATSRRARVRVRRPLQPLLDHDRRHRVNLLPTLLAADCAHNGRVADAARAPPRSSASRCTGRRAGSSRILGVDLGDENDRLGPPPRRAGAAVRRSRARPPGIRRLTSVASGAPASTIRRLSGRGHEVRPGHARRTPGQQGRPVDAQNVPRFLGLRTFARLPATGGRRLGRRARSSARPSTSGPRSAAAALRAGGHTRGRRCCSSPTTRRSTSSPSTRCRSSTPATPPRAPSTSSRRTRRSRQHARALHERGTTVIGLGGDHRWRCRSCARAAATHGEALAAAGRRPHRHLGLLLRRPKVTNGTIFRRATEEGLIDLHRSVQIGLRGGTLPRVQDYQENAGSRVQDAARPRPRRRRGSPARSSLHTRTCTLPTYVTARHRRAGPRVRARHRHAEAAGLTHARDARAAARADRSWSPGSRRRRGRGLAALRPERDHWRWQAPTWPGSCSACSRLRGKAA